MSVKWENKYYQRTTGTGRPCYICYKESTVVLATINTTDFFYVCPSHLTDSGFATLLTPPPADKPLKEEIGKVIAEYEAKEVRRKEKSKEEREGKDKESEKESIKAGKEEAEAKKASTPLIPSTPITPSHKSYALHRDIFNMRISDAKKKENLMKAKAVSKDLPRAPTGFGRH
ncbi:VPS4-associated protein 1 [Phaffia rhodozyma]|uniref:VPS4-associated protein 1 n=1 Tax=Phaffia rhodozyma TaxID=264483 RepID=A0A0F7SKH6_PHARH|nr:VPS4-associated protein 1 [Phaffia rhodozyma]